MRKNRRQSLAAHHLACLTVLVTLGCGGGATIRSVDPAQGAAVDDPDALLTAILSEHVEDGAVDYPALCRDDRLDAYVGYLARTDPDTLPTKDDRLAFWINAYNAYTLRVICDNYPVESINDLHFGGLVVGTATRKTVWHREFAVVGGEAYSLNNIEHDIIRKRFDDARIHFALVCAAVSCPPLRSESYVAEHLHRQLDDQGRAFFAQSDKNRFDLETRTAHLSKILDWYDGDFGDGDGDLLRFVARFLPDAIRSAIEAEAADWKIRHTHYDWSLNER